NDNQALRRLDEVQSRLPSLRPQCFAPFGYALLANFARLAHVLRIAFRRKGLREVLRDGRD
ncbi:MAG: hypothetical protein VXV97_03025, partial [Pseudomonadota bacterium]|nr:hypothetical protein [Pseudomonadota bacterium]